MGTTGEWRAAGAVRIRIKGARDAARAVDGVVAHLHRRPVELLLTPGTSVTLAGSAVPARGDVFFVPFEYAVTGMNEASGSPQRSMRAFTTRLCAMVNDRRWQVPPADGEPVEELSVVAEPATSAHASTSSVASQALGSAAYIWLADVEAPAGQPFGAADAAALVRALKRARGVADARLVPVPLTEGCMVVALRCRTGGVISKTSTENVVRGALDTFPAGRSCIVGPVRTARPAAGAPAQSREGRNASLRPPVRLSRPPTAPAARPVQRR